MKDKGLASLIGSLKDKIKIHGPIESTGIIWDAERKDGPLA